MCANNYFNIKGVTKLLQKYNGAAFCLTLHMVYCSLNKKITKVGFLCIMQAWAINTVSMTVHM